MVIVSLFLKLLESKKYTSNEDDCMISQLEVWRKSGVPPNNQIPVTPMQTIFYILPLKFHEGLTLENHHYERRCLAAELGNKTKFVHII